MAHIVINRPDQLNALDPQTMAELADCFDRAEKDTAVTGVVIGDVVASTGVQIQAGP